MTLPDLNRFVKSDSLGGVILQSGKAFGKKCKIPSPFLWNGLVSNAPPVRWRGVSLLFYIGW